MQRIEMEPIIIHPHHHAHHHAASHPQHHAAGQTHQAHRARPANVEALVLQTQREFPAAHIRITGRGRTVRRQAELMAQRRRANRHQFLRAYRPAQHITEMDVWVTEHPSASEAETVMAFEIIIDAARVRGATVSNHLSDRARDISIPLGGHEVQRQVRARLTALGAHVLDEHDAVGGAHWHIDY